MDVVDKQPQTNWKILYCKTWKIIQKERPQSLQEYAIDVNMIALINTIFDKLSTYAEFAELFVKRILKGYGRVDIAAEVN